MLRLTGGEFRGRFIATPAHGKTRPTQSRLRQALFNSLQTAIPEARVLDLFAGSGALGFEALSRGASSVVFVEQAKSVCRLIEKNAADLGVEERIEIINESVDRAWTKLLTHPTPFEVILADPPYAAEWEMRLLQEFPWTELLTPEGVFCLEWGIQKSKVDRLPDQVPSLVKIREKNYGDSMLTTFSREGTKGE